jgi:acetyl-CoA carboxylase biotin carboxylase subunit
MFHKVLIANRGEIAVRILRACRELGVRTMAVYSEADRRALHVRQADEAYPIGPALARDSYLHIGHVLDAARRGGAEAIHPGYGFLSENPEFAAACQDAGIVFVGPPASAIADMGDKVAARQIMQRAGVPILPGTPHDLRDDEILGHALQIGFPLFIKAAAGGGGKGIRLVETQEELESSLGAARREAMKAFGDDRVYLEKALRGARHVEIQVLADALGHTIHLCERDCSVQRRHQKLVEEAPSPVVTPDLRQRMGQIAAQAASAIGYVNAGTVEFLLDRDRSFYFLEMNTRLQVEHGVTESVTDVDIVKDQLRIAAGAPLAYRQEEIQIRAHAIECRITAEDPFNSFLPTTGRIIRLYQPGGPGVRIDSGIQEGLEISTFYDSLLAKLIVWGNSRREAMERMRRALQEYRIVGIQTSVPFHSWLMAQETFLRGECDTTFLGPGFGLEDQDLEPHRQLAAVVVTLLKQQQRRRMQLMSAPCDEGEEGSAWKPEKGWKLSGRWKAMG